MMENGTTMSAFPTDLKINNRMQVMNILQFGGEYTVNEIVAQTGLSRQTVMKAVQFFIGKGLVTLASKGVSTNRGGKRPDLYTLCSDRYMVGLFVQPEEQNIRITDFHGREIDSFCIQENASGTAEQMMEILARQTGELLRKNEIPDEHIVAVCLAVSGVVDRVSNVLKYSTMFPEWGTNVPLGELLRPYFSEQAMIRVDNFSRVAARALLDGPDVREGSVSAVVIFTGTELSACFAQSGHIVNGKDSFIGEIGHMMLDIHEKRRCECGGRGCFVQLVGTDRLRQLAGEMIEEYPDSLLTKTGTDQLTMHTVFEASARGDVFAGMLVKKAAEVFSAAIRNLVLVFDPDRICLQGEYGCADERFREELLRSLREFEYFKDELPFQICYDARPVPQISGAGAYVMMRNQYFAQEAVYQGD